MAFASGIFRKSFNSIFIRQGNKKLKGCLVRRGRLLLMQNNQDCFSTINQLTETEERLFSEVNVEIKGIDEAVLDSYVTFITKAAECFSINTNKVVLPRHIERYTVLKSPHIYKKHRAQYEIRTHRLLVQLKELTETTSNVFLEYIQRNCPEGVCMVIKQIEREKLLINIPPEALAFLEKEMESTTEMEGK
ncbi:28S ribosomal protein S10, mitochondrial-like [Xenia sp. Carnegie-2017]|uniref:28S ribosomal protein S10, mitochondrial-like n=1 Tax=Xenia sp. Carnegie-2017 TaxID=2897299 RepID=UPI001F04A0D9|nr:28S ribosomal protein S10, mitochondrial-like [Xenia sp. Carnegie-2017]